MSGRQALRSTVVLALVGAVVGVWPLTAAAADTVAFTIADLRVARSSGLVRDTAAGLYWTVDDSGAGGVAYGITPKGKVSGTLNFSAQPKDVEAVAMFHDRLYVADIGDNKGSRNQVTVYYFNHPRANGLTVSYHAWDFRYPDGSHDAETLLVNSSGRLFIVTKGLQGAVYEAPKKPSKSKVNTLTKVAGAPGGVTDGVFLPGDQQIALLGHTSVRVIDAKTYKQVATAAIPKQKQAESLAVSLDGRSLLVGSEGKRSKVYTVAVPSSEAASPQPNGSAAPDSGDSTDDPSDNADASSGQSRAGTFWAIGLAAFVAVVAGVVVAVVRKPGSPDSP